MHPSADVENVVNSTIRAAFEYQGQKCSACSRLYVPRSLWEKGQIKSKLLESVGKINVGQPADFSSFMTAVIDSKSFQKIKGHIDDARASADCSVLVGGKCDDTLGYFIQPTILVTTNAKSATMVTEIFGPVLTVFVYDDSSPSHWKDVLSLVNCTSPYALTGAVFAVDRAAIAAASATLRHACGNLYINDKCTGAVVGEQAFGGGRASGTNDKAGSHLNLLRWVSPQTIKESTVPLEAWDYPSMRGLPPPV